MVIVETPSKIFNNFKQYPFASLIMNNMLSFIENI